MNTTNWTRQSCLRRKAEMKSKLSRFAVPYVIWMALFVVAPIVLVVIYAFTTAEGSFTLENFASMGT